MNIFTKVNLPVSNLEAVVFEGTGKNLFDAFSAAGDDPTSRTKYLIVEVCKIDDKKITPEQIDEMHIRDALYLSQVVELMMKSL